MADIKQFVVKSRLTSGGKPKRSDLIEKIHNDNITIKYMSRDGLAALIQKQRQTIKPRSALNDAVLQNIKKAQLMTKLLTEKTSSLPGLQAARSKTSTSLLPGSKTLLRALSPDLTTPTPHGFRYRSNGDISLPRRNSIEDQAEQYEQTNQRDLSSLKQTLLKATMIHSRDTKGDYTFSPMLNELLKRESRASKSTSELSENLEIFRFITKDHLHNRAINSRTVSDTAFQNTNVLREKPLIGRRFLVKENDKFINGMMQQIYLLERSSNSQRYISSHRERKEDQPDVEIPLRGGPTFVQSDPTFMSARHGSTRDTSVDIPMTRAKSSFNIRYGVPATVLQTRKPLLDEYMHRELKRSSKTDAEIEKYIKDMQNIMAEKEKKQSKKEVRKVIPFNFWQTTEDNATLDVQADVPETASAHTEVLPDPA